MVNKNVIIYTNDHCKKSQRLINYLNDWDVNYEERNISKNQDYLKDLQEQGIFATPTVFIGELCIQGAQPERLKTELNI